MDQLSAHLDRGWDLVYRGDLGGALVSAEKSLELDSQSPEAHNLVGYVRAAQGEAEDALEHYRQAIVLDDTFVEAMLNAAELLVHPLHDFESAQALVEEALELAEDDDEVADALLISFECYMHSGDREAATNVAVRLPRGPFDNPNLDFMVGRALFEVAQTEAAEALLQRAVEREPGNADAHYFLGLVLEARDRRRDATRAFLKARSLDLGSPEPPFALPEEHFERRAAQAVDSLPEPFLSLLRDAQVVISDAPGVELVAEGVDPRAGLVLDALSEPDSPIPMVGRLFLYKRNIERLSEGVWQLQEEIRRLLQAELLSVFPSLSTPEEQRNGNATPC